MSLNNKTENTIDADDKSANREIYLSINKNHLNPIKINKSYNINFYNHKTIDLKNINNLIQKEDKNLINNNGLFKYLKNIHIKKGQIYKINGLSPESRNKSNLKGNELSISKSTNSNNGNNAPENLSPINNKYYINPNYIKLNSLFTLPTIAKKINPYNSLKTIDVSNKNNNHHFITEIKPNKQKSHSLCNKKIKLIKNDNKFDNKSMQIKKIELEDNKNDKHNNIISFMKFKYYEDVNEKMEKKLRDDSFIDRGVKDKIIKIGKFGVFWKNVMEYCSPLMYAEKYKNIKKEYLNKNSLSPKEQVKNKNNRIFDKVLYTNILSSKIIHNQSRNKNNI